eukprot:TRINITY_DN2756_c1_g1_i2.p2 TRINITY_DN2756_c1_g1~~TRINITY_DN2756_c1_g1_i2.p2  ORF type:complete len:135 (+),score=3.20 TRINITY_DN2756_c1_g1_i2:77-481(+)
MEKKLKSGDYSISCNCIQQFQSTYFLNPPKIDPNLTRQKMSIFFKDFHSIYPKFFAPFQIDRPILLNAPGEGNSASQISISNPPQLNNLTNFGHFTPHKNSTSTQFYNLLPNIQILSQKIQFAPNKLLINSFSK